MAHELKIGQKLWVVEASYRNEVREPKEATISKVGRKYFELQEVRNTKFEIETLIESNESNYKDKCYLTLQEILDGREMNQLTSKLREFFNYYSKPKLSLQQLRDIYKITQNN